MNLRLLYYGQRGIFPKTLGLYKTLGRREQFTRPKLGDLR